MGRPKGSRNGVQTWVPVICKRCGETFHRKPSAANSIYCSVTCYRPPRAKVTCQGCGKLYLPSTSTWGIYCSMECRQKRVEKQCTHCGKTFSVRASKAHKFNYCSLTCRRAARPIVTCVQCGKQFLTFRARATIARYCSKQCEHNAHHATITCAYCGKDRTVKKYRIAEGVRCCSNRCAVLLRMRDGFEPGYIGNKRRTGYRTDIEAMTEQVLIELGIPYIFEHKVSRYLIDFALPTYGVALECDGWQHLTVRGRTRDAMRDEALANEGWRVIHMPDKAIRTGARAAVAHALQDFFNLLSK